MIGKRVFGALVALLLTACAGSMSREEPQPDVVDAALAAGGFNTWVAVLQAADLVDKLKGPGPFTVFAPTDDAFAALPDGAVATLLQPANKDKLVAMLTYHVVKGEMTLAGIAGGTLDAPTLQGAPLAIDATSNVTVNGAQVVEADIDASNGVIHAIDRVLLPPA